MFRFLPPRESRRLPGRGGRRSLSADYVPGPRAAHSQPASWSPPHSPRSPWLSPPASPSPSSLSSDFPLARPSSMTPRPVALTAGRGREAGGHPPWPSEAQMLPTQNGPVLPSSPVSPVGTHPRDGAAAAGTVRTTWLDEARVTTSTANGEGLSESGLADMNVCWVPRGGEGHRGHCHRGDRESQRPLAHLLAPNIPGPPHRPAALRPQRRPTQSCPCRGSKRSVARVGTGPRGQGPGPSDLLQSAVTGSGPSESWEKSGLHPSFIHPTHRRGPALPLAPGIRRRRAGQGQGPRPAGRGAKPASFWRRQARRRPSTGRQARPVGSGAAQTVSRARRPPGTGQAAAGWPGRGGRQPLPRKRPRWVPGPTHAAALPAVPLTPAPRTPHPHPERARGPP